MSVQDKKLISEFFHRSEEAYLYTAIEGGCAPVIFLFTGDLEKVHMKTLMPPKMGNPMKYIKSIIEDTNCTAYLIIIPMLAKSKTDPSTETMMAMKGRSIDGIFSFEKTYRVFFRDDMTLSAIQEMEAKIGIWKELP